MNPDNYGSLPTCKKLAEVLARKGKKIETEAVWFCPPNGTPRVEYKNASIVTAGWQDVMLIPAYSMPEVWRELPEYSEAIRLGYKVKETRAHIRFNEKSPVIKSANPTDALIELWIWVLEEGK